MINIKITSYPIYLLLVVSPLASRYFAIGVKCYNHVVFFGGGGGSRSVPSATTTGTVSLFSEKQNLVGPTFTEILIFRRTDRSTLYCRLIKLQKNGYKPILSIDSLEVKVAR